jgi:hypothetical protein
MKGMMGHAITAMMLIAPGAYSQLAYLQVLTSMMSALRLRILGREKGVVEEYCRPGSVSMALVDLYDQYSISDLSPCVVSVRLQTACRRREVPGSAFDVDQMLFA